MKIDYAIVASDGNPMYLDFWPTVRDLWVKLIKIKPILVLISDKNLVTDNVDHIIHEVKVVDGHSTAFQSQVVRMFITKYYKNISYIPDISYNIKHDKSNIYNELYEIKTKKTIVGFALSRHIHNVKYIDEYNNCISKLYIFIKKLINLDYHIVLIPFNTHTISSTENDFDPF